MLGVKGEEIVEKMKKWTQQMWCDGKDIFFVKLDHNTDMHFGWRNNRERHKGEIEKKVCETYMVVATDNKGNQILLIWSNLVDGQIIFQMKFS